ncbi:MAG: hypothetical protein FWE07_01335 [Turicibacter sp.]|nr:hypothetical protein [Turicibacter sp.]
MFKKLSLLMTAFVFAFVLVACGGDDNHSNEAVEAYVEEHGAEIVDMFSYMGAMDNEVTVVAGSDYYFTINIEVVDEHVLELIDGLEEDIREEMMAGEMSELLEDTLEGFMVHFILLANDARDELDVETFRVYVEYSLAEAYANLYFDSQD